MQFDGRAFFDHALIVNTGWSCVPRPQMDQVSRNQYEKRIQADPGRAAELLLLTRFNQLATHQRILSTYPARVFVC